MATEKLQFQTETKRLLDLVINSIYTNKEIFLRELISNASDALDKLRIEALTNKDLISDDYEPEIFVLIDKEKGTITVTDNGIGMTRDEVINNIGTIAKSGTSDFLDKIRGSSDSVAQELIGQFGVGFYSAFIVADKVELVTCKAGTDQGVKWVSEGTGEYEIEDCEQHVNGTAITLYVKEEFKDNPNDELLFLNEYIIQRLIKKYSDFIRYPIKMYFEKVQKKDPEDEESEEETITEIKTVNSMKPLWMRNKDEITQEEYSNFLGAQFRGGNNPLDVIHVKAEGTVEYTALLFIPRYAPANLFSSDYEAGLQLFSRHVMVMKKCKDILPDWLRFMQGLVDSIDLPLNISRETLQHSKEVQIISKALEKNILKHFAKMLKEDRSKYEEFWSEFGKSLKLSIYVSGYNPTLHEKLKELFMFHTSKEGNALSTLAEYVERMPEYQKKIYVVSGKNLSDVEQVPQMELLKDRGLEVIYLVDSIDEFTIRLLNSYKDKEFQFITAEDFDLGDAEAQKEKNKIEDTAKNYKELLRDVKDILGNGVYDVRLTSNLKSKAICLVAGAGSPSLSMEKAFESLGNHNVKSVQILEFNPNHKVFDKLKELYQKGKDDVTFRDFCKVLYSLALLTENVMPDNPSEISGKIVEFIVDSAEYPQVSLEND